MFKSDLNSKFRYMAFFASVVIFLGSAAVTSSGTADALEHGKHLVTGNSVNLSAVNARLAQGDCYGSVKIYNVRDVGGGCEWSGATARDCNGNGCTCGTTTCDTDNGVSLEYECHGGC